MNFILRMLKGNYRQKTLILVTAVSALCVFATAFVFYVGDLKRRHRDTERDLVAASALLANIMRLPLYSGNKAELLNMAHQAIVAFDLSKVIVTDFNGKIVVEEPASSSRRGRSASTPISSNNSLRPELSIGGLPEYASLTNSIGSVTVYSEGRKRFQESLITLGSMLFAGLLIWAISSYIGYLLARRTTLMFDKLVDGIGKIESGETKFIDTSGLDEGAGRIAQKLNIMRHSLQSREEENISLHKSLAEEMESRAERAEHIMHAKLLQANNMISLGLLVSSIVHTINNANFAMKLQIESTARIITDAFPVLKMVADEEGGLYLGGMSFEEAKLSLVDSMEGTMEQSSRINDVVNGLRDYVTGRQSEAKKDVMVETIVQRSMAPLKSQIKRNGCTTIEKLDCRLPIHVNQLHIESVIANLLQNALRAVKNTKKGMITIASYKSIDEITISVSDNGTGIAKEDIPLLCDPFFSRHQNDGGNGLGLFISKRIMDDHHGRMEFISELGVGTTVLLHFPSGSE